LYGIDETLLTIEKSLIFETSPAVSKVETPLTAETPLLHTPLIFETPHIVKISLAI